MKKLKKLQLNSKLQINILKFTSTLLFWYLLSVRLRKILNLPTPEWLGDREEVMVSSPTCVDEMWGRRR